MMDGRDIHRSSDTWPTYDNIYGHIQPYALSLPFREGLNGRESRIPRLILSSLLHSLSLSLSSISLPYKGEKKKKKKRKKKKMKMGLVAMAILFLYMSSGVKSDGSDHKYKSGDPVPLYANKVGPFHNPR